VAAEQLGLVEQVKLARELKKGQLGLAEQLEQ
jgi:hypothetical protein